VNVLGLDPSLTAFGVSDGTRHIVIATSPPSDIDERCDTIVRNLRGFISDCSYPLHLLYEGPSFGSVAGFAWDHGYLTARVRMLARELGATFTMVPPANLKKFVTGKGNTPKAEMPLRVYRKWGIEFSDDRGADKLHAYCLHRYGLAVLEGELRFVASAPRGQGKDARADQRRATQTRGAI
jgi:crossover junction endodeoxyribonuclease RuvC